MKIAYVTAGAGGMICGSCLNDNTLARRLIRDGHETALVPIYTPIRTDDENVSVDEVFYGAINVYLEQKSALFRHTPKAIDRLLRARPLLDWASSRGDTIDARGLGELTLSMLEGENGKQSKELERLVAWLRDEYRPDVVHLTNSMLVGMARRMRAELGVPVLCSLQGEDIFLDELEEPYRTRVASTLAERARDVTAFVAPSAYYVRHMVERLSLDAARVHHVPLGIDLDGLGPGPQRAGEGPFTVGYLARICPEKGAHLLVDAFGRLVERAGRDAVRLEIAGYSGPRDAAYLGELLARIESTGLGDLVEYRGEVDREGKIELLQRVDVLAVPTVYREPKGRFVLEALACGTPVVLPEHGAFPELVEGTGGGVLVPPNDPVALAERLDALRDTRDALHTMGRAGRESLPGRYDDASMARATVEVYRRYLE